MGDVYPCVPSLTDIVGISMKIPPVSGVSLTYDS
jgi:hypothetical protein